MDQVWDLLQVECNEMGREVVSDVGGVCGQQGPHLAIWERGRDEAQY